MRTVSAVFVMMAGAGALASGCMSAASDPLPRAAVHVRGTVQDVSGPVLTVSTATGPISVELVPPSQVSMVVATDRGHLKDGSYMGVTSVIQPDGSLRALEVHIFPAGARRTGEGSFAWDLSSLERGGLSMINGTASHAVVRDMPDASGAGGVNDEDPGAARAAGQQGGTSLTLMFRSTAMTRSQALTIPWGIPIFTFVPGRTWDLKPGAHVLVIANRKPDGGLSADRVLVGKNGLVPSL